MVSVEGPESNILSSDFFSSKSIDILFLCDAFNSMTQRLFVECVSKGHRVDVHVFESSERLESVVEQYPADLIICPFLTKRVPAVIYENTKVPCWIVHPGIEGDRGISSLDWALHMCKKHWGVTMLQAVEKVDAGPIWATETFEVPQTLKGPINKSGLYRSSCIDAAVKAIDKALRMFKNGQDPKPLNYSDPAVKGKFRPRMKQADRKLDWQRNAIDICQQIRSADSQPGLLETLHGQGYLLYGATMESKELSEIGSHKPKTIIGHRDGAILSSCGIGAVWVSHLKRLNTRSKKFIKLPALQVLNEISKEPIPHLPLKNDLAIATGSYPSTFQEIFVWKEKDVAFCWFDFYNGAMTTLQCNRLANVLHCLNEESGVKTLVLMGGIDFFSNGINLNTIEAAQNPSAEAWTNINAIDDVVHEILVSKKFTVAAMVGNCGAGGAMISQAADIVWAHSSIVMNPSYKNMRLFGSEYWTYSLPKRVGSLTADRLINSCLPVFAKEGRTLGLIDDILTENRDGFVKAVVAKAVAFGTSFIEDVLSHKEKTLTPEFLRRIELHRQGELEKMKQRLENEEFHIARRAFVYKYRQLSCVKKKPEDSV